MHRNRYRYCDKKWVTNSKVKPKIFVAVETVAELYFIDITTGHSSFL